MPVTRVFIDKSGKIVIEGVGYIGSECIKDLQQLQQALKNLGIEVNIEVQQVKPEFQRQAEAIRQ